MNVDTTLGLGTLIGPLLASLSCHIESLISNEISCFFTYADTTLELTSDSCIASSGMSKHCTQNIEVVLSLVAFIKFN